MNPTASAAQQTNTRSIENNSRVAERKQARIAQENHSWAIRACPRMIYKYTHIEYLHF